MQIEIRGGVSGIINTAVFQSKISNAIRSTDSVISAFKTVKNKTQNISGGVGDLEDALDNIERRIEQEEKRKEALQRVEKKTNDFLELTKRIDKQVAQSVKQNKEVFYAEHPELYATPSFEDKKWYEKAWDVLCGGVKAVYDFDKAVKQCVKDTLVNAWNGLKDFWSNHGDEVINLGVTILCTAGTIVAIALIPVTGGASIALVVGLSALSGAIIAGTRSATTQYWDTESISGGQVLKDFAIGGVVGGVTGIIGMGLGSAISGTLANTALGTTLLNSTNTVTRVITGATVSATSEVGSGIVTRGAATGMESYLSTGTVNWDDVWDSATDLQSIAFDAALGGAFGGYSSRSRGVLEESTQYISGNIDDVVGDEIISYADFNSKLQKYELMNFSGEKNPELMQNMTLDDFLEIGTDKRKWRETEVKYSTLISDEYVEQVYIAPDLTKTSYKAKGSKGPDQIVGYKNNKALDLKNMDDFSVAEYFDVHELKNYSIEKAQNRSNLKGNIMQQANSNNMLLTSKGATVHQTFVIDLVGHGKTLVSDFKDLYESLYKQLPNNVDVKMLLQ